ncbi:MAG TPA: hypothetical protein PKA05_09295 [Roseiflexaceae bacterium]|nr:hypothetical protein [Roseiflexaceae bacterium]HMP40563.1 hypothetical protein [Roseiflexaceae bacterium]
MLKRLVGRRHTAMSAALEQQAAVHSQKAIVSRSAARSIDAGAGVVMNLSAAGRINAGGDVVMTAGAAPIIQAAGDLHLEGGAAGVVISREAHVRSGLIGILIARRADTDSQTRVLLSTPQVAAFAGILGLFSLLFLVVRSLLRHRIPPPTPATDAPTDEPAPVAVMVQAPAHPWHRRLIRWALMRMLAIALPTLVLWIAYRRIRRRIDGVIRLVRR